MCLCGSLFSHKKPPKQCLFFVFVFVFKPPVSLYRRMRQNPPLTPRARKQQERRSQTIIYKHIFERPSQRALGKYSSLQLTRKTIAQTTALRHKGHELLSWVFHGLFVAFPPTAVLSAFDCWLRRLIRLLILLFFFFFSFPSFLCGL